MNDEIPVTFREPSYAVFDAAENAIRTTKWGNLAIFSTKVIAEQWAASSGSKLEVIPVLIARAQ